MCLGQYLYVLSSSYPKVSPCGQDTLSWYKIQPKTDVPVDTMALGIIGIIYSYGLTGFYWPGLSPIKSEHLTGDCGKADAPADALDLDTGPSRPGLTPPHHTNHIQYMSKPLKCTSTLLILKLNLYN